MKKCTLNIFLILSFIFITGCGDLKKTKIAKRVVEGQQFNAGCELEISKFENIFKSNIVSEINCLEASMDLFLELVQTDRPGYLSRKALVDYVQRNVEDFKPENLKLIDTIFKVNHLVFGDDVNYIPRRSINILIGFLKDFNREIISVYKDFQNEGDQDLIQHNLKRDRVFRTTAFLSQKLNKVLVRNRGTNLHYVDLFEIIDSFKTEENQDDVKMIKDLLVFKRIAFGGQNRILTHLELEDVFFKSPYLVRLLFDVVQAQYLTSIQNGQDQTQRSQLELLHRGLEDFEKLLFFKPQQEEVLLSIDDLMQIVPHFTKEFPNLNEYRDSIIQLKMTAMTEEKFKCRPAKVPEEAVPYSKCILPELLPGEEQIKNSQFYMLLGHAKEILSRSLSFHRIYERYKVVLDSPLSINLKVPEVLLVFPSIERHVRDFVRIANKYRFFKGKWPAPYYDTSIRRNADALLLINAFEYVSTLVFRRYGTVTDGVGGYGVDVDQVEQIIWIFEKFLKDQQIVLEGRAANSAETATLMSALFQYQSDGDSYVNPNEVGEFASSIFTSIEVGDEFLRVMKEDKNCPVDEWDRITDTNCFRDNFYPMLCEKFLPNFPRMFSWLGITNCSEIPNSKANRDFLILTEQVARTCTHFKDGSEVPIGKNDMMGVLGALMNIEGTVTRWDQNGNNVMDPQEVEDAYAVFGSAIRSMVRKDNPSLENLSKQIYFYIVRYEKIPEADRFGSLMHFVGFLMRFNKRAPATRKTIASVLKIIAENGTPSTFDCDKLREPDIPKAIK